MPFSKKIKNAFVLILTVAAATPAEAKGGGRTSVPLEIKLFGQEETAKQAIADTVRRLFLGWKLSKNDLPSAPTTPLTITSPRRLISSLAVYITHEVYNRNPSRRDENFFDWKSAARLAILTSISAYHSTCDNKWLEIAKFFDKAEQSGDPKDLLRDIRFETASSGVGEETGSAARSGGIDKIDNPLGFPNIYFVKTKTISGIEVSELKEASSMVIANTFEPISETIISISEELEKKEGPKDEKAAGRTELLLEIMKECGISDFKWAYADGNETLKNHGDWAFRVDKWRLLTGLCPSNGMSVSIPLEQEARNAVHDGIVPVTIAVGIRKEWERGADAEEIFSDNMRRCVSGDAWRGGNSDNKELADKEATRSFAEMLGALRTVKTTNLGDGRWQEGAAHVVEWLADKYLTFASSISANTGEKMGSSDQSDALRNSALGATALKILRGGKATVTDILGFLGYDISEEGEKRTARKVAGEYSRWVAALAEAAAKVKEEIEIITSKQEDTLKAVAPEFLHREIIGMAPVILLLAVADGIVRDYMVLGGASLAIFGDLFPGHPAAEKRIVESVGEAINQMLEAAEKLIEKLEIIFPGIREELKVEKETALEIRLEAKRADIAAKEMRKRLVFMAPPFKHFTPQTPILIPNAKIVSGGIKIRPSASSSSVAEAVRALRMRFLEALAELKARLKGEREVLGSDEINGLDKALSIVEAGIAEAEGWEEELPETSAPISEVVIKFYGSTPEGKLWKGAGNIYWKIMEYGSLFAEKQLGFSILGAVKEVFEGYGKETGIKLLRRVFDGLLKREMAPLVNVQVGIEDEEDEEMLGYEVTISGENDEEARVRGFVGEILQEIFLQHFHNTVLRKALELLGWIAVRSGREPKELMEWKVPKEWLIRALTETDYKRPYWRTVFANFLIPFAAVRTVGATLIKLIGQKIIVDTREEIVDWEGEITRKEALCMIDRIYELITTHYAPEAIGRIMWELQDLGEKNDEIEVFRFIAELTRGAQRLGKNGLTTKDEKRAAYLQRKLCSLAYWHRKRHITMEEWKGLSLEVFRKGRYYGKEIEYSSMEELYVVGKLAAEMSRKLLRKSQERSWLFKQDHRSAVTAQIIARTIFELLPYMDIGDVATILDWAVDSESRDEKTWKESREAFIAS